MKIKRKKDNKEYHIPYFLIVLFTYFACAIAGIFVAKGFCWALTYEYTVGIGVGFGSLAALVVCMLLPDDNEK